MPRSSESKVSKQEYVFESSSIKCFSCGEPNHIARNCTNRARSNPQKRGRENYRRFKTREKNNRPRAYLGEENYNDKAISFIASQAYTAATYKKEIEFVIDSGASYHTISTEYEKYMTDIQEIQEMKVLVVNGSMISAKKKGNLSGICSQGIKISIKDCLIMDKLSHNLISVLK